MVKRGKMLKKVEQLSKISKVPVPGLDEMLASDRIAEFREELAQVEGSDIPIVEIAKAAGCYDLYIGVYATLSSTVHASVHDIEGQVAYSGAGQIDRKSVVSGKSVSVRVVLGGRRSIKQQNITRKIHTER